MQHVIAKPLTTTRRRLAVNDPVSADDDLSPHSFADLKTRGFIVEVPAEKPAEPAPATKARSPREPVATAGEEAGDKR
jgi:hypothetical protein